MQNHYLKAWMVLPLAVALAGALLALAALASGPAEAAGKFKFVTKTFDQPASVAIPGVGSFGPGSPYPSTKNVGGFPKGAKIVDVNLTLKGFSHDSPVETDFMIVHAGVNRTVMSDAGGIVEVGGLNVTLDDQAKAQLPDGFNDPLTSGKFKPANYSGNGEGFDPPAPTPSGLSALGGFRGKNPEGAWQLFVDDQFNSGEGFLGQGYSLRIKAKFRP